MRLVLTVRHSSPTGESGAVVGDRRERGVRFAAGCESRAEAAPECREDRE